MEIFFYLVVAYGITFGMQHKATFLRTRFDWSDKMLSCTYCTGFHAGWITWIGWKLRSIFDGSLKVTGITFIEMILFAMGSAAFSYFLDTLIRLMESHADPIDVPADDDFDLEEDDEDDYIDE